MDAIQYLDLFKNEVSTTNGQRIIVLASQGADYPQARNLVVRNYDQASHKILIHTHGLSKKVAELQNNPKCSLVWYHPDKKLQIQFYATAKIINSQEQLKKAFDEVPEHSKKEYYGPKPGLNYTEKKNESSQDSHFCMIEFKVTSYIILKLSRDEHLKFEYANIGEKGFDQRRLIP